ncbi:hypothetical protein ACHAWU_008022 [Discostella pseudostelligera]|uniref:Uncharacterized protein n=1 Tax=Discostella pseudostelligera TaxID=259834 RepID=A0ABD3MHY8_9STRA
MFGKDNMQALVADIGSYSTKIGYAGDDHPTAVLSSTTAVERRSCWSSSSSSNFVNGPKRDFVAHCINYKADNDGNYTLVNPVDPVTGWIFSPPSRSISGRNSSSSSGSRADNTIAAAAGSSLSSNENSSSSSSNNNVDKLGDEWESHELVSRYLQHAFQHSLGLGRGNNNNNNSNGSSILNNSSYDIVSHHPLLLLDKPHTPPALRQRLLEILFESHNLPAAFFLRDAVASCYAVGRTTATVVDVGHSSTMVSPVYEGYVENRGVLRNNACGAKYVDERILNMMDDIVKKQGGRRRKDRMRRMNQRKLEQRNATTASANSNNNNASGGGGGGENTANSYDVNNSSPSKQQQQQQQQQQQSASTTLKRDAAGHFIKDSSTSTNSSSQAAQHLAPIPDYLMPYYQVRRMPTYTPRTDPFHNWARITLAREIKEMGLGVAVGPMGYVSSTLGGGAGTATTASAGGAGAGGGGTATEGGATTAEGGNNAIPSSIINPASLLSNNSNVFLTSSKLAYTLPDGTPVEVSTSSRCDVAELYFGNNDEYNNNFRDGIFDETVMRMEEYEKEMEEFIVAGGVDGGGGGEGEIMSSRMPSSSSASGGGDAGDAYSNTSYRGEKSNRHGTFGSGGSGRRTRMYYPPSTISKKLYAACLPYIRTTPPNIHNSEIMDGSGGGGGATDGSSGGMASGILGSVNENYFHYLTSASPAQMVCDAAFRCDRDQQASLLGNVVVCGGGACITGVAGVGAVGAAGVVGGGPLGVVGGPVLNAGGGAGGGVVGGGGGAVGVMAASLLGDEHAFPDRLREEIEAIVHRHTPGWRVKVTSPNVSERAICSWLGGSILGSLSTFQDMWISRKDYEEYGAAIVNRKCP